MLKKIAAIFYGSMIALALLGGLATPTKVSAVSCKCSDGTSATGSTEAECLRVCAGPATQPSSGGTTVGKPTAGALENPLKAICGEGETAIDGQKCVQLIIGNVIKAALGIVGSIALLMMTYGGFLWLTSMGNSNQVEKGKNTLIWSTLGLALIFGAYALTSYIISIVNK